MRFLRYAGRRLLVLPLQLLVVSLIVFFLVRQLPGDPTYLYAGPYATTERVEEVRRQLGLDQPVWVQYARYVERVAAGDFGTSMRTAQPVMQDIRQRFPATLELILYAVLFSVVIAVPLGVYTAIRSRGVLGRAVFVYGMMAGSLPDFWFALLAIFVFFYKLAWLPGPIGRIDLMVSKPTDITGMYTVDSLLTANWEALASASAQLVLPVGVLTLVYMPLVLKNAQSAMQEMLGSEFVTYARAAGLPRRMQWRYALLNALPPIITVTGILTWFLLGGAVLVETVFAWGGLGQYAVQSVVNSDYAALQAVVLLSAVFTMLVFLLVDLAYFVIDPRIK
ncbi:ABC transporter permease [Stella sp.]|uniref:ABC transporter permease n=1 Tax=Stella sp. TaxID=2912054 RepID=UPI0035B3E502